MDQERGQLVMKRVACCGSLSIGHIGRNHHVAKQSRRHGRKLTLAHGKREDIRTVGYPPIQQVQACHSSIAHQHDPALDPDHSRTNEGGLPDLF